MLFLFHVYSVLNNSVICLFIYIICIFTVVFYLGVLNSENGSNLYRFNVYTCVFYIVPCVTESGYFLLMEIL